MWLFDIFLPQVCKSDISMYRYHEVFQRVPWASRSRESTRLHLVPYFPGGLWLQAEHIENGCDVDFHPTYGWTVAAVLPLDATSNGAIHSYLVYSRCRGNRHTQGRNFSVADTT